MQTLVERFGDGRWLLILDKLEHVVDAARDLGLLLAACPGVAILATSLSCVTVICLIPHRGHSSIATEQMIDAARALSSSLGRLFGLAGPGARR